MGSKIEYCEFYGCLKDLVLFVFCEIGCLFYMLVCSSLVCSIVEFGMFFGLFILYFVVVLWDNGGGCLIGSEFEFFKVEWVWCNLVVGGLFDLVELCEGDVL